MRIIIDLPDTILIKIEKLAKKQMRSRKSQIEKMIIDMIQDD